MRGGWGEAHEDPRITGGKWQSQTRISRSNKTSLLNRTQYARTKKRDSYTGGKGGFSDVIHEKRKVL